jgi:hypothetical protein
MYRTDDDHYTGRKCAICGGDLHDSIINFGEDLPAAPMEKAKYHSKKADLCIVLGSSLTVTPANGIPESVGERKGAELVICNLQTTPMDHLANLRIFAKADDLMEAVMRHLDLEIPSFRLERRVEIELQQTAGCRRSQLAVRGVDVDGTPASFLQSVRVGSTAVAKEPFNLSIRGSLSPGHEIGLELTFMGHYGEPNFMLKHECGSEVDGMASYVLAYDLQTGEWAQRRADGSP